MPAVPVRVMTVRVMTVGAVPVCIMPMRTMPVRFGNQNRLFELAAAGAKAGKLECTGNEHDAGEPRNVHRLFDEIANPEPEEIHPAARRHVPPDEHGHESDQHEAD